MSTVSGKPSSSQPSPPETLRIISLNCWGLKYISKYRHERLVEIGHQLAAASPTPSIVALQECWTQEDFHAIHSLTQHILPHAKFYFSGIFGGGLAILSAYPIEETSMHPYPLNGRPQAFFRGDWYVGKGVASARIRIGSPSSSPTSSPLPREDDRDVDADDDVIEVFCTHLHAPYGSPGQEDSYLCHRTAQAWFVARLLRHASERAHPVLGLGDFNMLPRSLAHRLIEAHSPARDVWRRLYPESAVGAARDAVEQARVRAKLRQNGGAGEGVAERLPVPSAEECLRLHGATCDSELNTWRWSEALRKDLERGRNPSVDPATEDVRAKRLDYVFFANAEGRRERKGWEVESVEVGMMARHPTLGCSLSDHFSVETTLRRRRRRGDGGKGEERPALTTPLPVETYDEILALIDAYELRERKQRRWVLALFPASIVVSVACLVAVWFSPRNFVAFLLMLVSTLGLGSGVLAGLIGGLFVNSELRALKEFRHEISNARSRAVARQIAQEKGYEQGRLVNVDPV